MSRITSINDLPEEVLEYILCLIPPYKDLEYCMLVCKRWHQTVKNVIRYKKMEFNKSISSFNTKWYNFRDLNFRKTANITKRYSHSACSYGNFMYVFGGCTCTCTTFNDLWKLDLSTRIWERLLSMGSYPSPKACATLVHYKNSLVLFGGWTHPSPVPLHQAWRTYNELHIYDIEENRWRCVMSPMDPPPTLAGHSATVHRDTMVVFGGLQGVTGGSNEVWCLDLKSHSWCQKETNETKPTPRYGQSQIYLDDERLLIIGGWAVTPLTVMSDVWLLSMTGRQWTWTEVTVHNQQWAASHLWCHPACRVDDYVVVMSRKPTSLAGPAGNLGRWTSYIWGHHQREPEDNPLRNPQRSQRLRLEREEAVRVAVDQDVNVNGRRGSLPGARPNPEPPLPVIPAQSPMNSTLLAFRDDLPLSSIANRRRERQLDMLRKMEEKLKGSGRQMGGSSAGKKNEGNCGVMAMYVLDIGCVRRGIRDGSKCCGKCASWLPLRQSPPQTTAMPRSTILYSLILGHAELVMFGGIEKDVHNFGSTLASSYSDKPDLVSNYLHFISAPLPII